MSPRLKSCFKESLFSSRTKGGGEYRPVSRKANHARCIQGIALLSRGFLINLYPDDIPVERQLFKRAITSENLSLTCQYAFALLHAPGLHKLRGDHPVHPGNLYSRVLEKPVH